MTLYLALPSHAIAVDPANLPATQSAALGKLPHVQTDLAKKQVRVECTMLGIDTPLEFFCVLKGTNEHESVLRTEALPSHIHFALLMMGLEPGEPVHYVEAQKKWIPPRGTAVKVSVEFVKGGKPVVLPASALMRDIRTKKQQPSHSWIFSGSKLSADGVYAADVTGYVVSVVNFDLTMVDIPDLASSANETLEWEIDKSIAPPVGTPVTMVIEPAGNEPLNDPSAIAAAASQPAGGVAAVDLAIVKIHDDGALSLNDEPVSRAQLVERFKQMQSKGERATARIASVPHQRDTAVAVAADLRDLGVTIEAAVPGEAAHPASPFDVGDAPTPTANADVLKRWQDTVASHKPQLQEAAHAHANIIAELRKQRQALIDQADQLQRMMDQLEQDYRDLVTAEPSGSSPSDDRQ